VTGGGYSGLYFGYINRLIQDRIIYPLQARRMGWQGRVDLSFVISENGSITGAAVCKSSGFPCLDKSALAAIKGLPSLPKPPLSVEIRMPVVFRLHDG